MAKLNTTVNHNGVYYAEGTEIPKNHPEFKALSKFFDGATVETVVTPPTTPPVTPPAQDGEVTREQIEVIKNQYKGMNKAELTESLVLLGAVEGKDFDDKTVNNDLKDLLLVLITEWEEANPVSQ